MMLPRVRSPLVRSVVVAGLLAKLARVMLPVPVKLTALPAACASVTVPTTDWAPVPWVIAPALVTFSVPVAVLPFNVIPPAVSVRAMLLPVAPTVTVTSPVVLLAFRPRWKPSTAPETSTATSPVVAVAWMPSLLVPVTAPVVVMSILPAVVLARMP